MKVKLLSIVYAIAILGLFLYSYTQVDLSLTLSKLSIWQSVEKAFQYIGYFQRPLSTDMFVILLILLFGSYIGILVVAHKKKISRQSIWILIFFTAGVLTLAYNAFSYDLFNYIFDAKLVTHYHVNPYDYRALDFPHDPMLSFMHWIERRYPYGPLWILFTIPFSFMGGQIFLITFYLFKLIGSLSFLGTAYFIEKIAKKISPTTSLFALSLFAFSPLVLLEGLVSAHNDMLMIFLSTLALYLLVSKHYVTSFGSLLASVAVKFATGIWVPIWFVLVYFQIRKKNISYDLIMMTGAVLSLVPVILATLRTNFQPWYFLYILPFAALTKKPVIYIPTVVFSFFALVEYIPFIYTGNWNPPIPTLLNQISLVGIVISLLSIVGLGVRNLTVDKKG